MIVVIGVVYRTIGSELVHVSIEQNGFVNNFCSV